MRLTTTKRGRDVINDPEINKGTAFTPDERRALHIEGLLPAAVETIDEQLIRRRCEYDRLHDDLERHVNLRALQDSNEVLFYRFLQANLAEMMPVVYTPTVGQACQEFSRIYRRPHGVFVSYPERGRMMEQFAAIDTEIDVIVVTDGERILGLGDQGVGGMGIPIGKLALYSAVGGIDPRRTLPIVLDVGTDNEERLADPMYLGWRHERVRGAEYDAFVEQFVTTISSRFPGVLLQWEDFAGTNATPLLERYRDRLLSFNDDIQGTAAVALGAIEAAVTAAGSTMADQRVCILGAGSAGTGIAAMVRDAIAAAGVPHAASRLFLLDRHGLLHDRRDDLDDFQQPFAQRWDAVAGWADVEPFAGLAEVVAAIEPTVLVGVSGQPGLFTEQIVRRMAAGSERPIIMPLSNPTSRAEATPADLLAWTDGRALVATGSPFDPVPLGDRTVTISQANNVYAFPGIGLGAVVAGAAQVTDAMFRAAAEAIANPDTGTNSADQGLLPSIGEVAAVSRRVAEAVVAAARDDGVGRDLTDAEITAAVADAWWSPEYPSLVTD
ncbi:MAG: NAD-dependent malic enzyme [Actinomycetota bacterium]